MKIEFVRTQKFLQIFLDELLYRELLFSVWKKVSFPEISERKKWEEWFLEKESSLAEQWAALYLAQRSYPTKVLEKKLKKKCFSPFSIEKALKKMAKYIDDEHWVSCFIEFHWRKGKGPQWIAYKIREKGIEKINVSDYISPAMQREKIEIVLENANDRKKAAASLARKGFSSSLIYECIMNLKKSSL